LGGWDAGLGTPLADIAAMADVEVRRASESVFRTPARKKSGLAVGIAVALVAAGTFIWWGPLRSGSATEDAGKASLPLETFVVNLSGSSQRAYLRIGITLGLAYPLPGRNQAETVPVALIRDTILAVLSTAQPEELLQSEGKVRLKNELLKSLQEKVPQIAVENVYFTEFLVQM
jgi:flagellar basal body-associated protein FliL